MNGLDNLIKYLPVLLPLLIAQLALMLIALISVLRSKSFKRGNKVIWILVICFGQLVGPILYFVLGRDE